MFLFCPTFGNKLMIYLSLIRNEKLYLYMKYKITSGCKISQTWTDQFLINLIKIISKNFITVFKREMTKL